MLWRRVSVPGFAFPKLQMMTKKWTNLFAFGGANAKHEFNLFMHPGRQITAQDAFSQNYKTLCCNVEVYTFEVLRKLWFEGIKLEILYQWFILSVTLICYKYTLCLVCYQPKDQAKSEMPKRCTLSVVSSAKVASVVCLRGYFSVEWEGRMWFMTSLLESWWMGTLCCVQVPWNVFQVCVVVTRGNR